MNRPRSDPRGTSMDRPTVTDRDPESPREETRSGASAPAPASAGPGRVHAARLPCENCGRTTVHRIVRWDPRSQRPGRHWNGVARCRECGWTHPFEVVPELEQELDVIVSRGAVSERRRGRFPRTARLAVGSLVPGESPPLEIRKIAGPGGNSLQEAPVEKIATLWVVPPLEYRLAVSVVEGDRTRSFRWVVNPESVLVVGEPFTSDEGRLWVVALRAQGRTWRQPGDRFPAREVQRLYGRRTVSPPAGSSDWRSGRGMPSSRHSSTSTSARRRSSPGESRNRT